jgi:aspartate/methionine/tyrosine aminotransferase
VTGVRGTPAALPRIGRRTAGFQESVIREMTRLGDEAGAVNLSQGLPDFTPPPAVVAAAIAAIEHGGNQYTFPFGSPAFRSAIAAKVARDQHVAADPETEVTVTCGVSEGMMAAILALTDPGDEVIILEPWYENYVPDCVMAGVRPIFIPLGSRHYEIDGDALAAHLSARTRLIVLNTPHNPTGRVFTRQELEGVAALCVEKNLIAVTDEIYEHILYDGRAHISMASLPGMAERTVTISGLGKTYAVTGWRVGWIIAAARLSEEIRKVHDYLTICAPAPFQAAGVVALNLPAEHYEGMRRQYAQRRDLLLAGLTAAGFTYARPEGAYYVMADFSGIRWDPGRWTHPGWSLDRTFAEYLAREVGVAVVPGSSFYATEGAGQSLVRFNFAKHLVTLEAAAERLKRIGPR